MIHQRQRLSFRFKAGDHIFGVHARFDDLHRNPPMNGFHLFGHEYNATASFANLL